MQAINKGLEKVVSELSTSENDGPISETFRKVKSSSLCYFNKVYYKFEVCLFTNSFSSSLSSWSSFFIHKNCPKSFLLLHALDFKKNMLQLFVNLLYIRANWSQLGLQTCLWKKKLFSFFVQWGSGLSVIGLIWGFICSDIRRMREVLKICIPFLLAKRSRFHIIRLKHCQSFTSFLFPPEIERVPLLSWSWSPFIGFTIFWRGRSSMIYLELLKPYKGYTLLSLYLQGRNVDALILYFGEDPARCPFEQGVRLFKLNIRFW